MSIILFKCFFFNGIHDNYNLFSRFVSKCAVVDLDTAHTYMFMCQCWIGLGIGEDVLHKTFEVATKKEKENPEYLFFNNTTM